MKAFLKGCVTALVTPFTAEGVDFRCLDALIDRQIENGADGLVVLGTTGEPATMTDGEKTEVIRRAVKRVDGRVPLLVGTGGNCTAHAVEASRRAADEGADGVLCVTPYYNKCTQRGLAEYYEAICAAVSVPVVAYNVPSRTGVNLLPETAAKIARLPNLAGIKDACGNMQQTLETARLIRGLCELYSGEDALNLPILCAGGTAVISVVSNLVPSLVKKLAVAAACGDLAEANRINDRLLPLVKACFAEVNPIPVKRGLQLLGFDVGAPRAPLTELEPEHEGPLRAAMHSCGSETV